MLSFATQCEELGSKCGAAHVQYTHYGIMSTVKDSYKTMRKSACFVQQKYLNAKAVVVKFEESHTVKK